MKPLDEAVKAAAHVLGLDDAAIARRKAFLEFTGGDAARLRTLHEALQNLAPDFVNAFYSHLLTFEETRRFISDPQSLDRLKRTQAAYFDSLTAGDYGPDYILNRLRVGIAHQRIGLTTQWYLGAYSKYLAALLPEIWQRLEHDPEAFVATCQALNKIVLLDMGLAIDTYMQADRQTILALKEYAEMVFASIPDGLVVLSAELTILSANRALLEQFGLAAEAVRGRHLTEVIVADGLRERALEVLGSGLAQHDVLFNMGAAGSTTRKPVRVTLTGIRLAEEEARLLVIVEDVSEAERLREQARAHETRYRDLVENMDAIVWEADAATFAFTFVSRRAEATLGYPVERWLNEPDFWANLIHPEEREETIALYREATGKGRDHTFEYRVVAADGRTLWLRDIIHVVRDDKGRAHRLDGVMVEITERKKAEEEVQRNLERIRVLREIEKAITSTLDLHAVLDVLLEKIDLVLPYATATTVRLFDEESGLLEPLASRNIDEQEWRAEPWRGGRGIQRLVFESKGPQTIRNVETDPRMRDLEFYRKHKLISYLGVPLIVKDKVLGVFSLYTKEEHTFSDEEVEFLSTLAGQAAIAIHNSQLYQEMIKLAADLSRSNRVKDEFLSVMSHELRTPLNVVMGDTGMIKDGMLGEINPEQEKALEKVLTRARDQLGMINGILPRCRRKFMAYVHAVECSLSSVIQLFEAIDIADLYTHCRPILSKELN